jgi:Ala-tRNA(Pro) deacylase
MAPTVFDRIVTMLESHGVRFEVVRHHAVYTSDDAARVRGTSLASGAKALVCKADDRFRMFVMPADLRLDSKRVRREHGIKKMRFADRDEVEKLTGLSPGSIPPFGSLFSLPTSCDRKLADQPSINFNAGDHCISISMSFADYAAVEQPSLGDFAQ